MESIPHVDSIKVYTQETTTNLVADKIRDDTDENEEDTLTR